MGSIGLFLGRQFVPVAPRKGRTMKAYDGGVVPHIDGEDEGAAAAAAAGV